jgi:hypothetical protein
MFKALILGSALALAPLAAFAHSAPSYSAGITATIGLGAGGYEGSSASNDGGGAITAGGGYVHADSQEFAVTGGVQGFAPTASAGVGASYTTGSGNVYGSPNAVGGMDFAGSASSYNDAAYSLDLGVYANESGSNW